MQGESRYLDFVMLPAVEGRKTRVVEVRSKRSGDLLGTIKWFGRWRQYTFWPEPETIFNAECLTDVETALGRLNDAHRARSRFHDETPALDELLTARR
jgi:hypothetical protein